MAFNGRYEYKQNGINEIISERGDMFLALREVRWSESRPFKLDLRNYKSDEDGERALKGVSFTDDDADEITLALLKNGFGDDDIVAETIATERPSLYRTIQSIEISEEEVKEDARQRLFSRRAAEDESSDEEGYFSHESSDDVTYYRPEELLA